MGRGRYSSDEAGVVGVGGGRQHRAAPFRRLSPFRGQGRQRRGVDRVETATWILDSTDPFYIRIESTDGSIDHTGEGPYSVTVNVLDDTYEVTRDDDPSVARALNRTWSSSAFASRAGSSTSIFLVST